MRPRLARVATIAALLVLAAGALVAWLAHHPAFIERQVAGRLLAATGWRLDVDGPLHVSWGRVTRLEARRLRLAHPAWPEDRPMATAGRLRIEFEPLSLFGETFVLRQVTMDGCSLLLAEDAQGVSNWSVAGAADAVPEDRTPPPPEGAAPGWVLRAADLSACTVRVEGPARDPLEAAIEVASLRYDDQRTAHLHVRGTADERAVAVHGRLGPVPALWQGGPLEHDLEATIDRSRLTSRGRIEDIHSLAGARVDLRLQGPDVTRLARVLGSPAFSEGPFDFRVTLDDAGGRTRIDVDGDLGALQVHAEGDLDRLRHPREGRLAAEARGPDLAALADTLGLEGLPPGAFSFELRTDFAGGSAQVRALTLDSAHARLDIEGALGAPPGRLGTRLELSLHTDALEQWPWLRAATDAVDLAPRGEARVDAGLSIVTAGRADLEGTARFHDTRLSWRGATAFAGSAPRPPVHVRFDLEGARLETLGTLFGRTGLPASPFAARGEARTEDGGLSLTVDEASLEDVRARGEARFAGTAAAPTAEGRFEIDAARMTTLGDWLGRPGLAAEPRAADGALHLAVERADLAGARLSLDGRWPAGGGAGPAALTFDLSVADLAASARRFALPAEGLPALPVRARGTLRREPPNWAFEDVTLTVPATAAGTDDTGKTAPSPRASARLDGVLAGAADSVGSEARFSLEAGALGALWPTAPDALAGEPVRLSGHWRRAEGGNVLDAVEARLGPLVAHLHGTVGELTESAGLDARLRLVSDGLRGFAGAFADRFPAGPLQLSAHVTGGTGALSFRQLSGRWAGSDVAGKLDVALGTSPAVRGVLASERLELAAWDLWPDEEQETPEPREVNVFDDTPLPTLAAVPVETDLRWNVALLNGKVAHWTDLETHLRLGAGHFELEPFNYRGPHGGELRMNMGYDARDGEPRLTLRASGREVRMALRAEPGVPVDQLPPMEIDVALAARGATARQMASSLDGHLKIFQGAGKISLKLLNLLYADALTQLVDLLNPLSKSEGYSHVDCTVLGATVEQGVVTIKPWVIRTREVTALSSGTIDLRGEEIDLQFNTVARQGLGLSAGIIINPFFKLGGTLAKPALEVDAKRGVISGGIAVATAGLSLLAKNLVDRLLNSGDPCGDARELIQEQHGR